MGDQAAWELSLLVAAVLAGAVVQGSIGFGFALVSTSAFGLVDPTSIPGTLLLLSFPINIFVFLRERGQVDVAAVRDVTLGLLFGTPIGLAVLVFVPADLLAVAFGAALIVAAAISVLHAPAEPDVRVRLAGGAVSGIITTVASTGGPAIALLFQRRPGPQLRATLASAFFISGLLSTIAVAAAGRIGWMQARLALLVLPALVVGLLVSASVSRRTDARWLRPGVLVFSAGAGMATIVRTLL